MGAQFIFDRLVLAHKPPKFSLVYQSQRPQTGSETKCLHTTDIQLNRSSWLATVTYKYYECEEKEVTRITGHVVASTLHDGKDSISDDTIRFYSAKDPSTELSSTRSQVIYNDRYCILMYSKMLGFQVWVPTSYLEDHNEVPYICTLLYEICWGKTKYFVYDFQKCPKYLIESEQ
ncbi:uncharacterized protein LOC115319450 [Ixodes scapularis]|uniref:uncharacterized protein LOC115319450 n=1 Tax=Ixodes scapularis TaxID=6945 RepID=UPI001A9F5823|nr:uncharacterized protein LOC115319450 [Ixodes scapularis]